MATITTFSVNEHILRKPHSLLHERITGVQLANGNEDIAFFGNAASATEPLRGLKSTTKICDVWAIVVTATTTGGTSVATLTLQDDGGVLLGGVNLEVAAGALTRTAALPVEQVDESVGTPAGEDQWIRWRNVLGGGPATVESVSDWYVSCMRVTEPEPQVAP